MGLVRQLCDRAALPPRYLAVCGFRIEARFLVLVLYLFLVSTVSTRSSADRTRNPRGPRRPRHGDRRREQINVYFTSCTSLLYL